MPYTTWKTQSSFEFTFAFEDDLDKDRDVDGTDLSVFATNFGRINCP